MILCYRGDGVTDKECSSGIIPFKTSLYMSQGEKMENETAYHCEECGRYKAKREDIGEAPECCGKKMEEVPLFECRKDPAFAEHARLFEDDEPCDPGMSGNN
jgi:hypothetical protein